jgi:hypothetical protein
MPSTLEGWQETAGWASKTLRVSDRCSDENGGGNDARGNGERDDAKAWTSEVDGERFGGVLDIGEWSIAERCAKERAEVGDGGLERRTARGDVELVRNSRPAEARRRVGGKRSGGGIESARLPNAEGKAVRHSRHVQG